MKLISNNESINCNKIELLDIQVDIVLKSLELASLASDFVSISKCKSKENVSRIALITDTYEQILQQYNECKIGIKNKNKKSA